MRLRIAALVLGLLATPAFAETINPADTSTHVGQTVTVEGVVSQVFTSTRSNTTFLDMDGRYPNNNFQAVIFSDDAGKFPNVTSLNGKKVDVTGAIRLYRGKPEIILKSADQIKAQ